MNRKHLFVSKTTKARLKEYGAKDERDSTYLMNKMVNDDTFRMSDLINRKYLVKYSESEQTFLLIRGEDYLTSNEQAEKSVVFKQYFYDAWINAWLDFKENK